MKSITVYLLFLCILAAAQSFASYSDEVLTDAPEAYYRFEETIGSTNLSDSTGNGHDSLSLSNVTFGLSGPITSAAVFSNGQVRINLQLDPAASDFSIEAVARFSVTDINRHIVRQEDGSGTGRSLLYRSDIGTLRSYLGGSATSSASTVPSNEWHHIVMTVEDGGATDTLRFYIDGQLAGDGTKTAESADGDWLLGAGTLIGSIDELAIYTNTLSEERIFTHYSWLPSPGEHTGDSIVHYVSTNGASIWPYTNWATAARFIQQAVDTAADGDTVLVTNGTYSGGTEIIVRKPITIQGVNGPGRSLSLMARGHIASLISAAPPAH